MIKILYTLFGVFSSDSAELSFAGLKRTAKFPFLRLRLPICDLKKSRIVYCRFQLTPDSIFIWNTKCKDA